MSITVQLQKFEGPLGLLLYLIKKEEMDILDINVHEITKQYLDYIKLMKEFDLEVAGEFIAMASTLIHIKSRLLLPQYDDNGEIIDQDDPRKELVQKLLEYQKYQEAAKALYERPLVGRDVWLRGERENFDGPVADEEILLEDNALFSLISSYRKIVKTASKKIHQVAHKLQSIASRILEMRDKLIVGTQVTLRELIKTTEDKARETLITFLSVLELGKMGFVQIYQNENYGDIYINTKKQIEANIISSVEEYDAMHAADRAQELIQKAQVVVAPEHIVEDEEIEEHFVNFEVKEDAVDDTQTLDFGTIEEEIASDEEILAAEAEMLGEPAANAEVFTFLGASLDPVVVESAESIADGKLEGEV